MSNTKDNFLFTVPIDHIKVDTQPDRQCGDSLPHLLHIFGLTPALTNR